MTEGPIKESSTRITRMQLHELEGILAGEFRPETYSIRGGTPRAPVTLHQFETWITESGGVLNLVACDGGHSLYFGSIRGARIELQRDYNRWLLTMAIGDGVQRPIRFWEQASAGEVTLPSETPIEHDVAFLTANIGRLIRHQPKLKPALDAIGDLYRAKLLGHA